MRTLLSSTSVILLLLGTIAQCQKKSSLDDDSAFSTIDMSQSLVLEHSFGVDDDFQPRGSIVFKNSKAGYASFSSTTELNDDEVNKLMKLVEENGLYFIRSPTKIGGTMNATNYVQTFVKACYLYGSRLKESITVSIDYSGNVIGLNIVSPRSACSLDGSHRSVPTSFDSSVIVQHQVAGAVPDVQPFIEKVNREKDKVAGGKGEKDNRSFLAKYWMYILPVFLILMLSAQAEPPAEGGGE